MRNLIGTAIDGRYRISRLLGAGGMGEVWLARQDLLNRDVALKVMHSNRAIDAEQTKRFQREARAISAVRDDNVVVVHDTGICSITGLAFIAMELIDGETLRARLEGARLGAAEANAIAVQIVRALAAAHGAGIVHRDVKPENVMLLVEPKGRAKLLDFGLARTVASGDTLTATGLFVGTPGYAAPEVVLGRSPSSPTSDMYSVGVLWFEMLTGRRPFEGKNALAIAVRQSNEPPPQVLGIPDLVTRLLAIEPAERPSSTDILSATLE